MRLRYSSKIFEELWNYGKWIGLSSIFTFAETNIQRIFIATSLSAIGFGIYSIALVWIESMLSVVRLITNRLAPPAFAEAMRMKVEDFQVLFDGMQIKLDLIILSFSTCIILFADTIFDFFYMGEYRNVSRMLLALTPLLLQFRFETFFQLQVMLGNGSASSRVTMLRLWGLVAVVFMIPEQVDGAYLLLIVSSASFVSQPYSLILCWKFISPLQKCLSILWFFLYAGIFIILQNKFSAS